MNKKFQKSLALILAVCTSATMAASVVAADTTTALGSVTISGTAKVGETLTAVVHDSGDTVIDSGITYAWQRDSGDNYVEIAGATSETYELVADDEDHTIKVEVTAESGGAYTGTVTSDATGTVAAADTTPDTVITNKAIAGVTVPAKGDTPVAAITDNAQFTGTVSWNPNDSTFKADTEYTATITLTAESGYTLTGVAANHFTVTGATTVTNSANSGTVTAVFPKTAADTAVDKTELRAAIAAAVSNKATATVSSNGSDIATSAKWVTQAVMTAYTDAINAAQVVVNKPDATEQEVANAVTDLATATTTFDNAKQAGTDVDAVDTTSIDVAIAAANAAKKDVVTAASASDVTKGTFWVTTEVMKTLNDAIQTATDAKDSVTTTTEAETAAGVLNTAVSTFAAAKKEGTKVDAVDQTITIQNIDGVSIPVKGGNPVTAITGNDQFTGSVTWNPNDSIFKEDRIYEATITLTPKAGYTLTGVAKNFFRVTGATATNDADGDTVTALFPKASSINTKAITDAVDKADDLMASVVINTSAANVPSGTKWVTQEEFTTLKTAMVTAWDKYDSGNIKTQSEADEIAAVLNKAIDTFKAAMKDGTKSSGTSGGGSSGGSGGGSSSSSSGTSSTPATTPTVNTSTATKTATSAVADAVKQAVAAGAVNANAPVGFKNVQTMTPDAFKAINAAAAKASGNVNVNVTVEMDTMVAGKVAARLYINPVAAAKLAAPINTLVDTNVKSKDNATVAKTFEKYFSNDFAVATFGQKGDFGMSVSAALKMDLSNLDTKTLKFYSYDKATNSVTEIAAPAYFIDASGYLHFTTSAGGSLVVTDKPLTRK